MINRRSGEYAGDLVLIDTQVITDYSILHELFPRLVMIERMVVHVAGDEGSDVKLVKENDNNVSKCSFNLLPWTNLSQY